MDVRISRPFITFFEASTNDTVIVVSGIDRRRAWFVAAELRNKAGAVMDTVRDSFRNEVRRTNGVLNSGDRIVRVAVSSQLSLPLLDPASS